MLKTKLITALLLNGLMVILFAATTSAASVSIQKLPTYITTNSFKLSCAALGGSSAQFYVSKHGGAFSAFGPSINLATTPCQVQVTGSQIDEQTDYTFQVSVDGATDSTSTIYDTSGPSGVGDYSKEHPSTNFYKLHWRNPSDSDFAKVIIYRGDTPDFSADSSHEIATLTGGAGSLMTHEDHFAEVAGKTYYYLIRALDKAGNSSGLVGDQSTVQGTPVPGVSGSLGTSGSVTQLPKELGVGGQVLPSETEEPQATDEENQDEATETTGTGATSGLFEGTRGKVLVGLALLAVAGLLYFLFKKDKE